MKPISKCLGIALLLLNQAAAVAQHEGLQLRLRGADQAYAWGENIELTLEIENRSDKPIVLDYPPLGPNHPLLFVEGQHGERKYLRRTSNSGPYHKSGSHVVVIESHAIRSERFLLYYDIAQLGQLESGSHVIVCELPVSQRDEGGSWRALHHPRVEALLMVREPTDDTRAVWRDFVNRMRAATDTQDRLGLMEDFVLRHPTSPMRPMMASDIAMAYYAQAVEPHLTAEAAHAKRLSAGRFLRLVADDPNAPGLVKQHLLERALRGVGDDAEMLEERALIVDRLLQVDPHNDQARRARDIIAKRRAGSQGNIRE